MTLQTQQMNSTKPQVIAFPARAPLVGGRQIYFMFSVRQVVDVLKQVDIQPASAGEHIVGQADWRGSIVPVLDLERSLGLRTSENSMPQRNIVVRSVVQDPHHGVTDLYAVCCVGAAVRQFQLPLSCQPVVPPQRLPGVDLIEGMYAMDEFLFVVVNLVKMVNGFSVTNTEEAVDGL